MKTLLQTLFFFLLVTQICLAQWVFLGLSSEGIVDATVRDSNIFAISIFGEVFRSTDSGANWTMILDSTARDVAISPSGKVFLIKSNNDFWWGDSLYSSLDNGETWVNVNIQEQLLDSMLCEPQSITISPEGIVYCCVHYPGCIGGHLDAIAQSTDDGVTWITTCVDVMGGKIFDFRLPSIITVGESYYCSTTSWSSIYRSSDYGNSWTYLGYPPATNALALFSNGNIIVGGEGSLNISTNNCSTWTQIATLNINCGLSYSNVLSDGILIGTDLGVFLFSNEGDSLGSKNDGLINSLSIEALTLDSNGYVYLVLGSNIIFGSGGVYRRPLVEIVSSIENETTQPTDFTLFQNYPNPFNPSTTISWQSPIGSHQTIKVFDVLGNEIATLIDEYRPAGNYEVEFNPSSGFRDLASGIYFYQLKAESYLETKKMILLK